MTKHKTEQQESQDNSRSKIPHQLIRNKDQQDKDETLYAWIHCEELRKNLRDILDKELNKSYNETESNEFLDKPNLTERIADQNGYRRALKFASDLLYKKD